MFNGRQGSKHRRVQDEDIEAAPPLGYRLGQLLDVLAIVKIHRRDRCAAAGRMNPLLDLLQSRRAAGGKNDMRTGRGKGFGGCRANSAACSGDNQRAVQRDVLRSPTQGPGRSSPAIW